MRRVTTLFLLLATLSLASAQERSAEDSTYIYYRPEQTYGSMSMVSPWGLILNGGFDILQIDGKDRRLLSIPYGAGLRGFYDNTFRHPGATISQIGWGNWLTTEVLPLNWTKNGARWIPNYQLHLIGSGVSYRMMAEWYHHQGIASPELWSIATVTAMHIVNEVVENGGYVGYNTDPIADFLIFNTLGIALFMNDDIARFFSEKMHMTEWSSLPMITFPSGQLGNNGLNYSFKVGLPNSTRLRLWGIMGMGTMLGASYVYDRSDEHSISFGAGIRGKELINVDPRARVLTVSIVPTAGIYWDRNNSLLASLTVSGQVDQTAILNVYPGVINISDDISPAIWAAWGSNGTIGFGIGIRGAIGVGYRGR
jgi:hypothetical protein